MVRTFILLVWIHRLAKKLYFKQRVIATAVIFFHKFYLEDFSCKNDPFIVIAACCFVAGKAEESSNPIDTVS